MTHKGVLNAVPCAALPKLAWVASMPLSGGEVRVVHGCAVERADRWLVEGVWDAPFDLGEFHTSEAFFGSGLRVEDHRTAVAASTGLVDRLLYFVNDGRLTISNSLVTLLAVAGARLDLDHHYGPDCSASLRGLFGQPYGLRVDAASGIQFQQIYHGNLVVADGTVSIEMRSRPRAIDSFESYLGELRATLRRVRDNYLNAERRVPVRAYTTLSSGYDSAAVACLARELGVTECFTTRPDATRKGWASLEDGAAIADALGLEAHLLQPPSERTTADEQYFLAPTQWGSELIFHDMARLIGNSGGTAVVFTGYHGDKVWDVATAGRYLADDIFRGDTSGLNLSEIRLESGFFNVAVPFLFARNIRALVDIARSPAMHPWRLGNDYDRPIPRRIVEEAGVPRSLFGREKRVVMSYYQQPFNPELRERYFLWLDEQLGIDRLRVRASELVSGVEWKLGSILARLGRPADSIGIAARLKRKLVRGHDPRHLMFKWSANELAARIRDHAGPGVLGHLS
jgi:hypothetical protein